MKRTVKKVVLGAMTVVVLAGGIFLVKGAKKDDTARGTQHSIELARGTQHKLELIARGTQH